MTLQPLTTSTIKNIFAFRPQDQILLYHVSDEVKNLKIELWKADNGIWEKQSIGTQLLPTKTGNIVTLLEGDRIKCSINSIELDKGKLASLSTVSGTLAKPKVSDSGQIWHSLDHSIKIEKDKPIEIFTEMPHQEGIKNGGYLEDDKAPKNGYILVVTFQ